MQMWCSMKQPFHYLCLSFFFFLTSSVEESTCSFSQTPFPAHCREFTRLFVRKFSSLLYVHKHPGNFTSHNWNVQNLSIRVYLSVSLLCPKLILLEEDKDFIMRQKKKIMENFALSQSCHATDMQRKISLCIAHNKKAHITHYLYTSRKHISTNFPFFTQCFQDRFESIYI